MTHRASLQPVRALLVLTLATAGAALPARAQVGPAPGQQPVQAQVQPARTITVTGEGQVTAQPAQVELQATIGRTGKQAQEALGAFRDARRQVQEALAALEVENLAVTSQGMTITITNKDAGFPPEVRVTDTLTLRLSNIQAMDTEALMDTLVKVIDTAIDAGLQFKPRPLNLMQMQMQMMGKGDEQPMSLARFMVTDLERRRQDAYRDAVAQARERAQRLAELAEVQLGPVVSLHDHGLEPMEAMWQPWLAMMEKAADEDQQDKASSALREITVRAKVTVSYAIAE